MLMIQDISPHRLFNEFLPETQPNPSDIIICLQGNAIMVGGSSGNMIFPKREDISVSFECRYLFSLDESRIFLAVQDEIDTLPRFCYMSLKEIRQKMKEPLSYMYVAYRQSGIETIIFAADAEMKPITPKRNERLFVPNAAISSTLA